MSASPPAAPAAAAAAPATQGSPTDFLKAVVGKRVVVRLVSGVDYKGAPRKILLRDETDGVRRGIVVPRRVHEHCARADR